MDKQAAKFQSVTIFILATNETYSLKQTVSEIQNLDCVDDIEKIVIVTKNATCPSYFEAEKLINEYGSDKLEIHIQKAPCVELCLAELPSLVKSTHFIIMVADGEMAPSNIDTFVERSKAHPEMIICAAKWHNESQIIGYGRFHEFGSRCLNTFISLLFFKKIKDPFSIYQIYPISVYNKLNFNKPEKFAYEYTIKALRNDIEYEEIPTVYNKRTDGNSNFKYPKLFQTAILFSLTALKIRFMPKEKTINIKEKQR